MGFAFGVILRLSSPSMLRIYPQGQNYKQFIRIDYYTGEDICLRFAPFFSQRQRLCRKSCDQNQVPADCFEVEICKKKTGRQ